MKKRILKGIAVVCALLMTIPFVHLAYAENGQPEIKDIIESCTLYKETGISVYYFYVKLFPDWTLTEPSESQCRDLKLRLIDSRGEPYYADYYAMIETFFDETHTFILRYAAHDDTDPLLLTGSEVLFPRGYFINAGSQQSDELTLPIDVEAMNADRVCYCPYFSFEALSPTMVGGAMDCDEYVWVPVGTEPVIRFEMEDEQAHRMHARLNKETGELTILRRGVTINVILYADGEPVDTRAFCVDKTYYDAASFLTGTFEAFGQGLANGAAGMVGILRGMALFIYLPFAFLFAAVWGGIKELHERIHQ